MSIKIVGITNCPAGIAHTYMAAEALKKEAEKRGYQIKIETQGAIGVENELTDEDIENADYVIIATGRGINDEELLRFEGKKILNIDVTDVLKKAGEIIETLPKEAKLYKSNRKSNAFGNTQKKVDRSSQGVFKHLMNGVSFMIPFITAGGILLAISTAMVSGGKTTPGTLAYLLEQVGVIGFQLMIPILAGYIAFSIADKPSLAPAMIGAWLANQKDILGTKGGAGFLGAIAVGLIVGYFVKWFKSIKVPKTMAALMSFLIIPTVATLLISVLVFYILGPVIAGIMVALTLFLNSLSNTSLFIICTIIGIMIVSDMGGPINKTAYLFSLGMVAQGNALFFGTVAITNVIPPVALGIATILAPRLFSEDEVANGKSAAVVGLFGITEPAIPYAVNDPISVIGAQMIAAAAAGIVGVIFRVTRIAPGAGILDPIIGIVKPAGGYYIALIVGIVINVLLVITFKGIKQKRAMTK
ncbi:fructose-specific PTS transporter subunit EIIC [Thermoanaerobacterium thermosaccharolyticum]|uniref:PTS system IICB component, Fru family n=1 Tax=Thermoanaerobacterium thermosaccharolyticum M0795 TaxID=698948 RepID=L0IIL0_THETR|nr:fructose-specific PTS transporter subunit EIIC [Thermoanaerobacterium thermosaccharolyticum]AGB19335.1 PTS system IICB component, Fru family [Thermoanaerobacterium thermosaccharolyticum M0795]